MTAGGVLYGAGKILEGVGRGLAAGPEVVANALNPEQAKQQPAEAPKPEEKQDKSNGYNTFAHPGLPVGPIGSPGDDSIKAAANPDDNDYYYWVTVNLDTGETKFAENFEEHNRNVDEYQQWCADNEGRCS